MTVAASTAPSLPPSPSHRLRGALLLFLLWTGIGLSFASQFYLSSSLSGRPIPWSQAISYALADWYVWAALSLVILRLCQRFPLERLQWSNHLLVHLIASVSLALAYTFLRALVAQAQNWVAGDPVPFSEAMQPLLFKTYHFNFIIYWVIASVAHAANYYRKFHQRERATLDLERRLTEARLQALRMQLNPHFLFNAMHSVSALMHKDVEAADSMLARLSELLRLTLNTDGAQTIPLSEELAILQRYLDIERIRFGDRLTIELDIAPAAQSCRVPALILQPVVENSLRHGIAPYARPGTVRVAAKRENDQLILTVEDNGGGLTRPMKEGIGLSNSRARLAELYGEQQSLTIEARPEGGLRVVLSLPAEPDATS